MSDVKKEIKFNKSMTVDKRDENFAYLRKNIAEVKTPGMYPAKDFMIAEPMSLIPSYETIDILGKITEPLKIIIKVSTGNYKFYELYDPTESNTAFAGNIIATAYGYGYNGVYFVDKTSKKVYSVNYVNTNISEVGTFPSTPDVVMGGFDGLYYWWVGKQIWKQLSNGTPVLVFSNTGFENNIRFLDFYDDQIVFFTQKEDDIIVYFWSKQDSTVFQDKIIIKKSILLAGGVIDGQIMLVRSTGNIENPKEKIGEMIISAWNGKRFTTLNSILLGKKNVSIASQDLRGTSCRTAEDYMIFSVDNSILATKAGIPQDLYKNYVYKVYKDGKIEAITEVGANGTNDSAEVLAIGAGYNVVAINSNGTDNIKIYTNRDNVQTQAWKDYAGYNEATYITNFYGHPYNYHRLEGISIAFEKMYKNTDNAGDPPDVSVSTIVASKIIFTTLTLDWTKATDLNTQQDELEYSVYQSSTNNLDTIENILLNGTLIKDWTADINTLNVTGLDDDTDYYYNVLVRDLAGNTSKYATVLAHTFLTYFVTAWTDPTNNGIVSIGGTNQGQFTNPINAYAEDGSFAVADNVAAIKYNTYFGFGTFVPVGATIIGIQIRDVMKANTPAKEFYASLTKLINQTAGVTALSYRLGDNTIIPTTSLVEYIHGTPNEMWGSTWTPSEMNASTFGIIVRGNSSGGSPTLTYSVDNLQVRAVYTI